MKASGHREVSPLPSVCTTPGAALQFGGPAAPTEYRFPGGAIRGPLSRMERRAPVFPQRTAKIWFIVILVWNKYILFSFFCFFGLQPRHMEVPGLGVKSEPQLPAYTTATAMWIRAVSATYPPAHGNTGPRPPEQGQGLTPQPHGY